MRISTFLITILTTSVSFATSGVTNTTIKVGQTVPLLGPNAPSGIAIQQGTIAAFQSVNKAGGIFGRKLELLSRNDNYEPEQTKVVFDQLVKQDHVFAFLTMFGGTCVEAVEDKIAAENIPVIGPLAPKDFSHPLQKNIFAVRMTVYDQGRDLVRYLVDDAGIKEISIFYQDDLFGQKGKEGALAELKARNLEPLGTSTYKRNSNDVDAAVNEIAAQKPKAVIIVGVGPAMILFVKKLSEKRVKPVFAGGSAVTSPNFLKVAAQLGINYATVLVVPLVEDKSFPLARNFLADMSAAGFSENLHPNAFEAYIHARIFIEALKKIGKDPTQEKLKAAIEGMNNFDLEGLKLNFSPTSRHALSRGFPAVLKNGELVPYVKK